MPSYRISLISNANQAQKITFLLTNLSTAAILKAAKDKLRLKKPSRIFLPGGDEIIDDITEHLQNGAEFLISCGEDFIGVRKTIQNASQCEVSVIAKQSFIDPAAKTQLHATATLNGMVQAVGMPDLHPGTKSPIGAAFVSEGYVYPPLIGGDIGCGMAVYRTALTAKDVGDSEVKKIADRLTGIEGPWDNDVAAFLSHYLSTEEIEEVKKWEGSLGTIGAGNHFAELQQITQVMEPHKGFEVDDVVLVVHSGSRGLGKQILGESKNFYAEADAGEYLRRHDTACRWAKANRDLIALRFLSRLSRNELSLKEVTSLKMLDIWHNNVENVDDQFIHRKGAAPATSGMVIIPGSRGTLSAYVEPFATSATAFSLAHGAGRAQSRTSAFKKLSKRYRPEELQRTKLGGWVICEDKDLIYEEAPEGYKEVETVVADLVMAEACKVVAWGMPRVSYKVRK
jgi:release factor H-coupled RctB family protein